MGGSPQPENQAIRIVVDAEGVEWEVYDEGEWSMGLALDWDHPPQLEDPGLIFSSRLDRRRLWPCPADWRGLTDEQLLELVGRAVSIL